MKFAICDEDRIAGENLISLIEDYSAEKKISFNYEFFTDFAQLESRIGEFDVFFLEYHMPQVDGLTFARKIRALGGNRKVIIFVTTENRVVFDVFTVNAHRFLMKPIEKDKLYEALDAFFFRSSGMDYLMVKCDGRVHAVDLCDIFYIEVMRKDLYIHCRDCKLICRRSIASVEEELQNKRFFRVHRSYLVNMDNIKNYDSRHIVFPNGETIDISTRKYTDFCEAVSKR